MLYQIEEDQTDGHIYYSFYPSLITGHGFVILSHFVAEGYVAPYFSCEDDPTSTCYDRVEIGTFWVSALLLLSIYAGIGAVLQTWLEKRKKPVS